MRKRQADEQSPSFQFYANDWISDPDRIRMSLEEQGAYILLYCHCWRGHKIPLEFEILSKMCNCTIDKINIMWPRIKHMFREIKENQDIYLICLQAEEERKEQQINRTKRQIAGKKGAKARWGTKDVQ
tara:strand:+ start:180 stop:563 length:384 start_codon:yes stop_codon:yes gene_type:complete